jgi:hypothetical protein
MKTHEAAIRLGRFQQALVHVGSIIKAANAVGMPYSTAWRTLKGMGQSQASRQRRSGSLSALEDQAAYDLPGAGWRPRSTGWDATTGLPSRQLFTEFARRYLRVW